jgi:hypothetical protein
LGEPLPAWQSPDFLPGPSANIKTINDYPSSAPRYGSKPLPGGGPSTKEDSLMSALLLIGWVATIIVSYYGAGMVLKKINLS